MKKIKDSKNERTKKDSNMNITDFDDIRPYNPDEFLEAMQRIAHSSSFPILSAYEIGRAHV